MQEHFASLTVSGPADRAALLFSPASLSFSKGDGIAATDLNFHMGEAAEKRRVLLVDDAPDVLEMLAFMLRHGGYEVWTAVSARDALQAAQAEHFDLVVSDIGMPGMNGYDLAMALRAMPDYSGVPMVAVTGFSMYDDRERALQSGFNAHMTKPINPSSLLDLLAKL
ncbi:MAG: response regulator [Pyrinomonadaceae bacterium]|nr:response regulator [Pyrinomonadaceae bacterium]